MKRFLISLLIGLSALTAFGQEKSDAVNQRYFEAKIRELVYHLNLTDGQKEAFIPIYRRYNDEMRAVVGERKMPESRPGTSEEAAAVAKARIERQQQAQSIRMKYVDEFATVLEPDQLNRLYEVEGQIQRKLMNRQNGNRRGEGRRSGEGRRPHRQS
jgi:Spy/CpxP family protein refolding chaperone